ELGDRGLAYVGEGLRRRLGHTNVGGPETVNEVGDRDRAEERRALAARLANGVGVVADGVDHDLHGRLVAVDPDEAHRDSAQGRVLRLEEVEDRLEDGDPERLLLRADLE